MRVKVDEDLPKVAVERKIVDVLDEEWFEVGEE